jgi:integrase
MKGQTPKVKLFIRVRLADGTQVRVSPAKNKNHGFRPLWAVVKGKDEHHPEGTYVLRLRDQYGRRRWLTVGKSLDAAIAARARKEKEIKLAKDAAELDVQVSGLAESGAAAARVVITEAFAEYLQDVKALKAPKTWGSRKRIAEYFLQSCNKRYLDEVTRRDLLDFRAFLGAKGLKDRSVFNAFQSILSTFRALGVTGLALKTDTPSFTERAVRAYSDQEVQKLFAECTAEEKLLYQTFLFTGCREQEIQYLTYPDIDPSARTIAVRAKENLGFRIKDREERLIPVPQALVDALESRKQANPGNRFVFPGINGQPNGHMLRLLKKVALRAGLNCGHCENKSGESCSTRPVCSKVTLHSFRRTFATMHFEAGVRAHTLQRWLGHSDLETTLRYLAVADVRSEAVRTQVESTFGAWAGAGTRMVLPDPAPSANSL